MPLTVLTMVDGLRPDVLKKYATNYPNFTKLMSRGSWTLNASSVMPSITMPCHMSIFHSVLPARHGLTSNDWAPMQKPIPGLVELAYQASKRCAFFYNWEKLRDLNRPGNLSYSFFIDNVKVDTDPFGDRIVLDETLRFLERGQPCDFLFEYFGTVDETGGLHGWMTDRYLDQIAFVDGLLGKLVDHLPGDATILVQADHGGHDFGHGTELKEDMTIPWMIAGPGIRVNYEIEEPVSLLESAPTLARIMGIEASPEWDGHCVDSIFI
jgi:predicted AlkP superfamily pyrophosphatase or phosphodiesterase